MLGKPKPTKLERTQARNKKKRELKRQRKSQALYALERDKYTCVVPECDKPADDVHHVFGRGREASDPREFHTSLLSVCREHHPGRVVGNTPGKNHEWVVELLESVNGNK